jgi:hypothetical protein
MLKYSKANAKIEHLSLVPSIAKYLEGKRKVYSFDILSGHNCPYAKECRSAAVIGPDGKRTIQDGPETQFRCFSASQEVLFSNLYKLREANGEVVKLAAESVYAAAGALMGAMPNNAGIIRIHVGGDFKTRAYFQAWLEVARQMPDRLFYAYTKSLPFWVDEKKTLAKLPNFVLTASRGGYKDNLIKKHRLRESVVVFSEQQAADLGLAIDHDDSHAADPLKRRESFALLLHGTQPAGTEAATALKALKGKGSYARLSKTEALKRAKEYDALGI